MNEDKQAIPLTKLIFSECMALPIHITFNKPELTDQQVVDIAHQLETDVQQQLLKLLEDNDGKIPYSDHVSAASQKMVVEAYNSICHKYGLQTISIEVGNAR